MSLAARDGSRAPIQSLWIGSRLSNLERLTIRSFQRQGHPFHLYVYDPVDGVPAGTRIVDAGEILPASRIFQYRSAKSYAGFANLFRYKLLHERGGWWADLDVVCLRPFDFAADYVFSSEEDGPVRTVTSGVFKAPPRAPVLAAAWQTADAKDPDLLRWGETGPRLLDELVTKFGLGHYVEPPGTFMPIPWQQWRRILEPDDGQLLPPAARAVHLWNEMWRREGLDKDRSYPADSLFERLKQRYLG